MVRWWIGQRAIARMVRASAPVVQFGDRCVSVYDGPPMVVGWMRPRILLPLDFAEWEEERLEAVLQHETAHLKR
ncbi:MAG: beta-lactamase regulating signal transducer with metallopeptidase domain [Verrucomicrobiales bacterium]|jgi:beta-lactamase regulating signal transducer with metallopeptidase domain